MDTNAKRDQVHECFRSADDMGLVWIASDCLDHIDALTAENKKLRDALEHIANDKMNTGWQAMTIDYQHLKRIARDAIKEAKT